jgi:penicillin G amidase
MTRRSSRYFLYTLIILVLLFIGLGGFGWWIFHRSLPQLDGTHQIVDLKSEVTVQRDAKGVPHIRAQSREDLCVAQGYVMAQDRLWQMDLVRRAASGRLSEIIGPATLEIDRSFRRLGLSQAAEREVSLLDADERAELEAFARGINRYIAEKHPLPVEFVLLRYDPDPWRPADTLLIIGYMYQTLTTSWRWDLNRPTVSAHIGKERAAFLYDQTSPFDHPIVGAEIAANKSASKAPATEQKNASSVSSRTGDLTLVSESSSTNSSNDSSSLLWGFAQNILFQFDEQIRAAFGSNNWVVDGSHTASGKPLLANDTHLSLSTPSIWYLVQLSVPGWNAGGFTLPGVPGIVIGHNDQIAWGFTNDGADVQDLYAETFNPANSLEYRVNNQWVAAQLRKEIINVRGKPPETLDVIVTRHGTVMSQQGGTGYALKWTATEPGGLAHSYFRIQFAHNWNEFKESLRDAAGPAQNIVYADIEGRIGFIVAARIPIRKCEGTWPPADSPLPSDTPCGAAPMPGDTDAFEWNGYIPFDELPQVFDPPGGIIATANARVAGPSYPHFVTANWMTPWRVDRIFTLLGERGKKFQPEDFNAIQNDIVSEFDLIVAKALVKASDNAKPKDDRTAKLIAMLANWDGQMKASSVEATFVEQTERALGRNLFHPFVPDSLPVYPRGEVFLERVLRERPAMWLPAEFHNYDDLLIASADLAVAELTTSTHQSDISTWTWGKRNALFMPHALGQTGFLARIFSIGPVEQSGATGCIKAMGPNYGPSMRMVADVSDWDKSLMEITTGESGQVASENYQDEFPEWFGGRAIAAPFSDAAVQRATTHTLRLLPSQEGSTATR